MKIKKANVQPVAGQSLRYIGKGFPGYVEGSPYMVFLSRHNATQYLVQYNDMRVIVSERYVLLVG